MGIHDHHSPLKQFQPASSELRIQAVLIAPISYQHPGSTPIRPDFFRANKGHGDVDAATPDIFPSRNQSGRNIGFLHIKRNLEAPSVNVSIVNHSDLTRVVFKSNSENGAILVSVDNTDSDQVVILLIWADHKNVAGRTHINDTYPGQGIHAHSENNMIRHDINICEHRPGCTAKDSTPFHGANTCVKITLIGPAQNLIT